MPKLAATAPATRQLARSRKPAQPGTALALVPTAPELPASWPPQPMRPWPELTPRQIAGYKAAANRDSKAAGRKAAETRRRNAEAAAAPPAFTDWVSRNIGARNWTVGPVAPAERALFERIISPEWLAALRTAYRLAFASRVTA